MKFLSSLFFIFQISFCFAQIPSFDREARDKDGIRIVFYNLENLFDTKDDSLKRDDEFTPQGKKYWSWKRYQDKIQKHAKTLTAVGGWEAPALIGVCEVENYFVLEGLTKHTILKRHNYQILHQDSPDNRGIDVALLYREDKFAVLELEFIEIKFPDENPRPTRDILYVKGVVLGKDTLHVFVNHWPSRYGGMLESEPKRKFVASVVRQRVDDIFTKNPKANIVIMGDLNDEPENKSITEVLKVKHEEHDLEDNDLFNLMYEKMGKEGSHKFQGQWGILDHIIVSTSLMKGNEKLSITPNRAKIFKGQWLFRDETRDIGETLFRTYQGYKYLGGYSDHLPVYVDLAVIKDKVSGDEK